MMVSFLENNQLMDVNLCVNVSLGILIESNYKSPPPPTIKIKLLF